MLPRERAFAALNQQKPNRVPIDFMFTRRQILFIIVLFLATRVLLTAVGAAAVTILPASEGDEFTHLLDGGPALDMWYRWDAGFYATIATYGYDWVNEQRPAEDMAFLPLYPMAVHGLMRLSGCSFSPYLSTCATVSGLIVSNIALLLATFLLFDVTRRWRGESAAWAAVGLLLLSPGSVFFSGVYTEALFLLLVLLAFALLDRDRFTGAVIAACFAALTRSVGVALVPALLWYVWKQQAPAQDDHPSIFRTRAVRMMMALPPGVVFAAYIVSAGTSVGSPLAYFQVNDATWGRSSGALLDAFTVYFSGQDVAWFGWKLSWLDLLATLVYLALVAAVFRQRPLWGWFALFAILIPMASGMLVSMPRYGIIVFPFYAVIGAWLAGGQRSVPKLTRQVLVYGASFALMLFVTSRFVTWKWIA